MSYGICKRHNRTFDDYCPECAYDDQLRLLWRAGCADDDGRAVGEVQREAEVAALRKQSDGFFDKWQDACAEVKRLRDENALLRDCDEARHTLSKKRIRGLETEVEYRDRKFEALIQQKAQVNGRCSDLEAEVERLRNDIVEGGMKYDDMCIRAHRAEAECSELRGLLVECKTLIGVEADVDTLTDVSLRIDAAIGEQE